SGVGRRPTEVPSWPLRGLLVFKATCWLWRRHLLVSTPPEKRGSSGIDVADLEPSTQPVLVSPVPSEETYRRGGCQATDLATSATGRRHRVETFSCEVR